jgi:hypothetical protein
MSVSIRTTATALREGDSAAQVDRRRTDAAPEERSSTPPPPILRRLGSSGLLTIIVVIGLSLTGLATWAAARADANAEQRLLEVQTKQAAAVLSTAILVIQQPLASGG